MRIILVCNVSLNNNISARLTAVPCTYVSNVTNFFMRIKARRYSLILTVGQQCGN